MKFVPGFNLRRTLLALIGAIVALLIVIPFLYGVAGVRKNLEDRLAPTRAPQVVRQTPLPPTAVATQRPVVPPPPTAPTSLSVPPSTINGIPIQRIVYLSDAARVNIRDIFAQGQEWGRNPRSVSKIGDSTMVYPPFLAAFDGSAYRLGRFAYLQSSINYWAGSFERTSVAVKKGMHTWSEFDPAWSVPELCAAGESPLACEIRLSNPSIAIVRLGANDTSAPQMFEQNLGLIVKYLLARGIIPVLGTKPDRTEGQSNLINNIIRKTASAYSIPLWDYDLVAGTVPGRWLEPDQLHIRAGGTRDFASPAAFQAGDSLEDLTALLLLDAVRREIGADQLK